jgi:hypothetical protein
MNTLAVVVLAAGCALSGCLLGYAIGMVRGYRMGATDALGHEP